ncbi:ABC transporter substrate-binding protein [Aeromonas hydrophila]|uniref:ABC transporter substrate-binding protein n=1 Tax=Aeromonas hydrophila TaxID=644 RepID=A0A926FK00_AERHY|nr:ABC transporter substrate-binding protein [Aeromonas hydrophila]
MAIEVLEEAARRLKGRLTIELMPLARALQPDSPPPGRAAGAAGAQPQREPQFLWIAPLLMRPSCWSVIASTIRPHHQQELPGLTVGVMRGSYGQSLLQPYPQVKQALVAEEIHNASKLALGRIQGWAVAWNSARYNQQQAGLPLKDLVRGDTLQRASLYLAASPVSRPPGDPLAQGHRHHARRWQPGAHHQAVRLPGP